MGCKAKSLSFWARLSFLIAASRFRAADFDGGDGLHLSQHEERPLGELRQPR